MAQHDGALAELLAVESIKLDLTARDRADAIRQVGALLVESGAASPGYVGSMLDRERAVSTFVGEGIAMPHGTLADNGTVVRQALSLVRFRDPVDWQGEMVDIAIGIAAIGKGQVALLSRLAILLLDPHNATALRTAATAAEVRAVFGHMKNQL